MTEIGCVGLSQVRTNHGDGAAKYFADQQHSTSRRLQLLAMRKQDLVRRLRRLDITAKTDRAAGALPPGLEAVLLKAVQVAAFSPNIAVGEVPKGDASFARRTALQVPLRPTEHIEEMFDLRLLHHTAANDSTVVVGAGWWFGSLDAAGCRL